MKLANIIVFPLVFLLNTTTISAQLLTGQIGISSEWKSGWLDLDNITDFARGDTLEIFVGGKASKAVIRLLPEPADGSSSIGIEGGFRNIPTQRILRVILGSDHKQIKQISVHGGESPWRLFPISPNNGPATVAWIKLYKRRT